MNNDFFKVFIASVIAFWIGMFWEYYTQKKEEEKGNAGRETCVICCEQHKVHAVILKELENQIREKSSHE